MHRWSGYITPWKVQIWWKYFGNRIIYISRCEASLELAEPPFQTLNLFPSVRWFGWSWKIFIDQQFWSEGGFKDIALPKHQKLNKWLVTVGEAARDDAIEQKRSFKEVSLFDVEGATSGSFKQCGFEQIYCKWSTPFLDALYISYCQNQLYSKYIASGVSNFEMHIARCQNQLASLESES